MGTDEIGGRIASYRRRRGLSQAALAGLVGRSESWLSQVERGLRPLDRHSVILQLARVLRVDTGVLTGHSSRPAGQEDPIPGVAEIRELMMSHPQLDGGAQRQVTEPAAAACATTGHRAYQDAHYGEALLSLPSLIEMADELHRRNGPSDTHISVYVLAAKLLKKVGAFDLASTAADRAAISAIQLGSIAARGLAAYQVASVLQRLGQGAYAEKVAVRTAEQLHSSLRRDDPTAISVTGALWLLSAVIAARQTDPGSARQRLQHASGLANLLGNDGNYGWTAFGRTNVAIHRVSVATELGDAGEAVRLAAQINPGGLPESLRSRRAQVNLDLAWAQAQRKNDSEAVLYLLDAESVAPGAIRYSSIVRELIRQMLQRQRRGPRDALEGLAQRAGVLTCL